MSKRRNQPNAEEVTRRRTLKAIEMDARGRSTAEIAHALGIPAGVAALLLAQAKAQQAQRHDTTKNHIQR